MRVARRDRITANNDRARGRLDGFCNALQNLGVSPNDIIVREARYQIGAGRAAMQSLLAERRDITALFCGSDILAAGALFECKQQGIAVPDDLSVVGFDNLEIAAFTDPPLSTLNVPAHDMGVEAAKYIIDGRNRGAAKRIEINVEFVDRKTTSPPRNII